MKDSFDPGSGLLSDMARHPAFAPDEIERQRQQMLSGLQVSFEDPGLHRQLRVRSARLRLPSVRDAGRTARRQSIAGITRDDLVAFHARYFAPNNAILADRRRRDGRGGVRGRQEGVRRLGEARRAGRRAASSRRDPTRRVVVVNKPDAVQTEVRVGHIGIARTNPDYMAFNLAIRDPRRRGQQPAAPVLRTERGLTYGAQADMTR